MQRIMSEQEPAILADHVGLGLSLVRRRCHTRLYRHSCTSSIHFDDNSILAELFLNQNDLFRASDNKVSSWVKRAFCHLGLLCLSLSSQIALVTPQHNGDLADFQTFADYELLAFCVP